MKIRMIAVVAAVVLLSPLAARAHCDTLDGPVIKTARTALDANDVAPVLAWVKASAEPEIRLAFRKAVDARKKSPGQHEATDHRFFETLVRVHRAGEGAPYTGLKPAGEGLTEGLKAADLGIEKKDGSHAEELLVNAVRTGLRDRFAALNAQQPPGADVAAGRKWVEAYVEYVHYVERVEATAGAHGDGHAVAGAEGHEHAATVAAKPKAGGSAHAHAH